MDSHSRTAKKKKKKERKSHGIEVLPQDTAHLLKDHVTNEEVFAKIQQTIGLHEDLTIANSSKLKGCGHVSSSLGLAKTILQGSDRGKKTGKTEEEMGRQHQGRDRPGVRQIAKDSGEQKRPTTKKWRALAVKSSVLPQRPSRSGDK